MTATTSTDDDPTTALRTYPGRVRSTGLLTPTLLEVVVDELQGFELVGPDTFAYLLVRTDGAAIDPGLTMADFLAQGDDGPVRGAYYTVRRLDPADRAATFWIHLHDHDEGVAAWMRAAAPGRRLLAWGPRTAFDLDPADRYLLLADETGLAAVAATIESLPPDAQVIARLEVDDLHHAPPMPDHPGLDLRWLVRPREPGTGDLLATAVRALELPEPGRWAAFGGAESRAMTEVRRHLRDERGMRASQVSMTGYWRRSG